MTTPEPRFHLTALCPDDMECVLGWRTAARSGMRTPYILTDAMQAQFFQDVVNNRQSQHRYWAVREPARDWAFVAMVGLTYLQWENGLGEIALITNPAHRGEGVGSAAVDLALAEGFEAMRLATVCGEVYMTNPDAITFWSKQVERLGGHKTWLPRRKFWAGQLWNAMYFTFTSEAWTDYRKKGDSSCTS